MGRRPQFLDPVGAAAAVPDGATLALCGSARVGVAEAVLSALGERFRETASPRDLTLYCPVESGDRAGVGLDHLAQSGMLSRIVAGAFIYTGSTDLAASTRMVLDNEVEAYNLPMGTMFQLLRETAAGRPGLFTKVGLGTFVEPERGGGRLNARTTEDLMEYVEVDGERYLRYRPIPIDVAIIRATTADEHGNLTMESEASLQGMLVMAQAAKSGGGLVIAQVQRVAAAGSLPPQSVRVPGHLVDVVVTVPDQEQMLGTPYQPAVTGELRLPASEVPEIELPLATRIIARRAAAELPTGGVVNLGFGLSAYIPVTLDQDGDDRGITFFVEQGASGGISLPGMAFGAHVNPESLNEMPSWFDFLDSGAFDATCLGWGEVDAVGSIRNHVIGSVVSGCGGFIDITSRVPKIVFCGPFTAGGLQIDVDDGRLVVLREGRHRKFRAEVMADPTLNGPSTIANGQEVVIVTERCVLRLDPSGRLRLDEVAPGITPEQIVEAIPFDVLVSDNLQSMNAELFTHHPRSATTGSTEG